MTKRDKLHTKILSGTSDANIQFDGLCQLLRNLGFEERIKGSPSYIYKRRSRGNIELAAQRPTD